MQEIFTLDKIPIRAAKLYPNKIAFKYMAQTISYRELDTESSLLANYLVANGLKKGDRVGIFLPRCIEIPKAIYGILKAGGVFVPLDMNMPSSRLALIAQDCQISFLIANKKAESKIKLLIENTEKEIHTIGLEKQIQTPLHKNASWEEVNNFKINDSFNVNVLASDLAYIIYTSGTTGMPKGIMHTHYSGLSYAKLSQQLYEVNQDDIIANHSPLHFDISTFGYLTSPLSCATTVIISEGHTKFPVSLAQLIKKEEISIWYSVPVALMQLSDLEMLPSLKIDSIRWVLFGGESYPTKQLLKLMKLWSNTEFSNVYGPAEVNQCTFYTVPKTIDENAPIPIGKVWSDTEMLILDDNDEPVPQGKIGKLFINSATMMYGYWNNEKLTNKGIYIQTDPNMKTYNKKYYRTGDLVILDNDGLLQFLGRGDRQIKTRGYRVELNEVESTLVNISEIEFAAVFPYENNKFGKLIGAEVVLKTGSSLNENEIKKILSGLLPKYCLPEKICITDSIKRTSAGKVDYKLLIAQNDET